MPKRMRDEAHEEGPLPKRSRPQVDRISRLSDELVLKVLAYLPVADLTLCQRLSRRFNLLAGDSELWKEKYYSAWVRPRARRIPGLKDTALSADALKYSSTLSKWLDDGHLVQRGKETNWKRQYRLRQNWSRGSCRVNDFEVAQPPIPPVVAKFHRGVVFTVDSSNGLRAWSTKTQQALLASTSLEQGEASQKIPSSLGVDTSSSFDNEVNVIVGFDDGSFCVYTLHISTGHLAHRFSHPPSSNGSITAIASASPYVLTMSQNKLLSLYRFPMDPGNEADSILKPPELLASLTSSAIWSPLSLSIRTSTSGIVACIAYALSRIGVGWSVGLQELRLTEEGESVGSRLASTVESELDMFTAAQSWGTLHQAVHRSVQARSASATHTASLPPSSTVPTSLSYSHPYLLASHPDNTLTIYLVVSNADNLIIKTGRRLWGHTSSVSGAQVSDRGKAVSVSAKGNEIRIWELEDLITTAASRRADASVQVSPEKQVPMKEQDLEVVTEAIERRGNGLGLALREMPSELFQARGWVGFDDEQVVVLREEHAGTQILSCYDFR